MVGHMKIYTFLFLFIFSIFFSKETQATTYYSQGSDVFTNTTNWNTVAGGGGTSPAFIDLRSGLHDFIIQDAHDITIDTSISILSLEIGEGTSGSLIIGDNAVADTLIISNTFTVNAGASFYVGAFTAAHRVELKGSLLNDGTINLRNSSAQVANLILDGTFSISGTPTQNTFNNITFNTGGVTTETELDINGSVVIEDGATFIGGGLTHTLAGSWSENGTGAYSGTLADQITFDGTIVQAINGTSYFRNAFFNGGAIITLGVGDDIRFYGNFELDGATNFTGNANPRFFRDFTVNAGSTYNLTGGTSYFSEASVTQNIDCSGDVTFNAINLDNGIPGSFVKAFTGDFTATAQTWVYPDATVTGSGDYTLQQIRMDGTCSWSGSLTITAGTIYTGNASNSFELGTAEIFINGTPNIQANDTMIVSNNVTIVNGTYLVMNQNSDLKDKLGTNTFTQDPGTNFYLRGTNVFPSDFANFSFDETSNQRYDRNYKQYVEGDIEYGNLLVHYDSAIFEGPTVVKRHLYIYNSVIAYLGSFDHHFKGYIYTNGTPSLVADGGTVYLDGDVQQVLGNTTDPVGYSLHNVVITDALNANRNVYLRMDTLRLSGNFTSLNPSGVGGDEIIIRNETNTRVIKSDGTGSFNLGDYTRFQTSGENSFEFSIESFASTNLMSNSTVYFTVNGNQNIPGITYGNLWINGNGNKVFDGNADINGNYERIGGTPVIDDGGFDHTLAGNYNVDQSYTRNNSTGSFTFDGIDQIMEVTSYFNELTFANSGTVFATVWFEVENNFTMNNGSSYNGDNNVYINEGDFLLNPTAVFEQTNNSLWFRGTTGTQNITMNVNSYTNNLINLKEGVGTDTLKLLSDVIVNNTFYNGFNSGGWKYPMLDLNGYTANIQQAWVNYVNSDIKHNEGTIHMNGSSVIQYLYNRNPNTIYYNMTFSGSAEKVLADNSFDINGDVTINNTTLNGSNREHFVAGDWNNVNGTLIHSNNLHFDGVNQNIDACNFWTTIFTGSGTKTLDGNIDVNGGLRIDDLVTLDVSPSNYRINVQYWWDNDRTGIFEPRNGLVVFDGTVQSNLYTGGTATGKQFYDIALEKSTQGVIGRLQTNDIHVQNDFDIVVGRIITDNRNVFIGGDFINDDEFQQNSATNRIEFIGTSGSHEIKGNVGGNNDYRSIVFNAGGATYQMTDNLSLRSAYGIIINDGILDLNANALNTFGAAGNITINGGELQVDSAAELNLGGSATLLNAGGVLRIIGHENNDANIQQSEAGNIIVQQTSGTIFAKYFKISGTSGNGVDVQGGSVDLTNAFSNGTFTNGTGNASLTLGNTVA